MEKRDNPKKRRTCSDTNARSIIPSNTKKEGIPKKKKDGLGINTIRTTGKLMIKCVVNASEKSEIAAPHLTIPPITLTLAPASALEDPYLSW